MLEKIYNPQRIEETYYALWEETQAFQFKGSEEATPYVIMMPPPNVTGSLHMGHALNLTLQDILVRHHRMRGADVLWQPGMDHAGIATQSVVERQLEGQGIKRTDLSREAFVEKIWQWKGESGGTIVAQQRRLGLSPDWCRQRFTLDEDLNEAVRQVFVSLYRDGLIYRAKRLVNWDPQLLTAVSDLEVKPVETKGHLFFLRYDVEGNEQSMVVATTRPETLFGDTALAVHPEDERYQHLIGKRVRIPLQERWIPIIADTYCDPEKGTGVVKITPAHDFNDFDVGQRHQLEMISIFDEKACLNDNVPAAYRGLDRFVARRRVIEDLRQQDRCVKQEDITHAVPHGERSNAILEPFLTDQWFVDAKTLAQPALQAVEEGRTQIMPESAKATYYHWMNTIQPWCISRQLWWGHRIPAWFGPDQHIFVATSAAEAQQQACEHYGHAVDLHQDEDVLDTWFSSALWPFSTLGWPQDTSLLKTCYPTSVLITGMDILFFWVARMMMMGLYLLKDVPFKAVYLHALVRDQQGQKMSKSKGNVEDPLVLMDTYGTDALRFSMAALITPARDLKFSTSIVESYRNFATKLWNATRFCLQNKCLFEDTFDPFSCDQPINRWMMGEIVRLTRTLDRELAAYRFNTAAVALYHTIWGQFCDWYLELIKPLLLGENETVKQETQQCAAWCLAMLVHLLHPFMPFVTEEIWRHLNASSANPSLLITANWPCQNSAFDNLMTDVRRQEVEWVIELITALRTLKATLRLAPQLKVTLGVLTDRSISQDRLKKYQSILERLGRIEMFVQSDKLPSQTAQIVVGDTLFYVPLGNLLDIELEKTRLHELLTTLDQEKASLEALLNNEHFLAKANSVVIEKNRTRWEELEQSQQRYHQALAALSGTAEE